MLRQQLQIKSGIKHKVYAELRHKIYIYAEGFRILNYFIYIGVKKNKGNNSFYYCLVGPRI